MKWLFQHVAVTRNPGRKPRIMPLSPTDRRNNEELHRRREAARLAREAREACEAPETGGMALQGTSVRSTERTPS